VILILARALCAGRYPRVNVGMENAIRRKKFENFFVDKRAYIHIYYTDEAGNEKYPYEINFRK